MSSRWRPEHAHMDPTDSPIESWLLLHVLLGCVERGWSVAWRRDPDRDRWGTDDADVEVTCQEAVRHDSGWYHVDIVIRDQVSAPIYIECDGHAFHERTPEQAARDKRRDRWLTRTGVVLRFTGSEINRDPTGCAAEVLDRLDPEGMGETPPETDRRYLKPWFDSIGVPR